MLRHMKGVSIPTFVRRLALFNFVLDLKLKGFWFLDGLKLFCSVEIK